MFRRVLPIPVIAALFFSVFADSLAAQSRNSRRTAREQTEQKMTEGDVNRLLKNVEGVGQAGVPGPLCIFGENAVSLIAGKEGSSQVSLLAAAKFRQGRVVAFGHGGYLSPDMLSRPGSGDLLKNILLWLARDDSSAVIAVIGNDKLADLIEKTGFKTQKLNNLPEPGSGADFRVLVADASRISEEQVNRVGRFVTEGGGLLTASLGWGWLQVSGKTDLKTEHTGNQLLGPMGIVWSDGYLHAPEKKDGENFFPVPEAPRSLRLLNVTEALKAVREHQAGTVKLTPAEIATAISSVDHGIRCIPEKQYRVFAELAPLLKKTVIPTEKNKIKKATAPEDVLAITLQTEQYLRAPARGTVSKGGIPAMPAANDFPGMVPGNAKTVTKTIAVDTAVPDWHSTGLYAVPGRPIIVRVPTEWINATDKRHLGIRIGSHSDRLWGSDEWSRYPDISMQTNLKNADTALTNPFGGLIYVTVPGDFKKGTVAIEIGGAVESPLYVHGKTSLEDWKKKIRNAPGPWGELASDRLILTTRTENLKNLDNPDEVMEFWNKVLDACADLCGRPQERDRPERMVCDRQISAGYMHSGYPVMTWMDVQKTFVDLQTHPKDGWGFFHEFGHNHQSGDWTFGGTTEVTVNLFTLYVFETVAGIKKEETRREIEPEWRKRKREEHFAKGSPFDTWKKDAFLALIMYVDMIDAFGWDAFKDVFREYRKLSNEERPKNDDEKRDQWMVRMSRRVGKNLGPYFDRWGVPVSSSAKDSIKDLPVWEPYK